MTAPETDMTNPEPASWVAEDHVTAVVEGGQRADQIADPRADIVASELADTLDPNITIRTEKLADRQRRIVACTEIPFSAEQLWQVLTDYDNLASFIPNLTHSQRLSHPEGGIRLEQVGAQCFLSVKFCARVVLDMVETFPRELSFAMVEGDFRKFEGKWTLEPGADPAHLLTRLSYDLVIRPPRAMPAGLIERHIRHDLSRNFQAIHDRARFLFSSQGPDSPI